MEPLQPARRGKQAVPARDPRPFRALLGALLALSVLLLSDLFVVHPRVAAADTIRISGTGSAIGTVRLLGEAFRAIHPDAKIVLSPGMGSSGGIEALLGGRVDITLCARPLTGEERARGVREVLFSRSAFVFAVNGNVRADRLTVEEIADIYRGGTVSWEDGSRIRPVLRYPSGTDGAILKSISPEMKASVEQALRREGMIVAATDQDAADAIEKIPGAFGTTTLALVLSEKRAVRVLAVGEVAPNAKTLADGTYPFVKSFFLVTREYPSRAVREFVAFVRSPAGARILLQCGSIPVY
jgi:phosphate transport system substrate-binding protein